MKNKNVICAGLILLIALQVTLPGCIDREPGRYYNRTFNFSIKFPPDWEILKGNCYDDPCVAAASFYVDDADWLRDYVSVEVFDFPQDQTFKELLEELDRSTENELAHYYEISKGERYIDNIKSQWSLFTYTVAEGPMKCLSICIPRDEIVYLISCNSEPKQYRNFEYIFEEIVESFRLE